MKMENIYIAMPIVLVKLFFSQQALAENPASNIDKAGNEIRKMSLIQVKIMSLDSPGSNKTSVQGCTNDRDFCFELNGSEDQDTPTLKITRVYGQESNTSFELSKLKYDRDYLDLSIWPNSLQMADAMQGLMIGIEGNYKTMYSGGGATSTKLHLFHLCPTSNGLGIRETLVLPTRGSAMIRACFSERDYKQRRGACHDEYELTSKIQLDKNIASGFPKLIFQTHATSFPPRQEDAECTFRRVFSFDNLKKTYKPNKALPICEGYIHFDD